MNLRFTLSNTNLGTLVLDSSPAGWEELSVKLNRDPEYHGIGLEFPVALRFHCKAGRKYLLDAYKNLGIDAEVMLTIERCCGNPPVDIDAPDYSDDYSDDYGSKIAEIGGCEWLPFVSGIIQMKEIKVDQSYVTAPVIQSTEYQKFKNRIDNQVDTQSNNTLDGNVVSNIDPLIFTLHNKGIVLVSKATIPEEIEFVDYGAAGFDEDVNVHTPPLIFGDENFIQDGYDLGINIAQNNLDLPNIFENITPYERSVTISFRLKYNISGGTCGSNTGQFQTTKLIVSKFETDAEVALNAIELDSVDTCNGGNPNRNIVYNQTLTFAPGEKFKVWVATSVFDRAAGAVHPFYLYDTTVSFFSMKGELPFPATTTESYGLHEAGALIAQRVLGRSQAFYSESFGRVNSLPTSYPSNGCDSFGVLFTGLQARKFPDSHLRMSLKEYYTGLNPIYNLGMGIEFIDGYNRVRVERKEFFYSDEVLFRLKSVKGITTSLMQDYFMNEVRIGFDKWETEEVSGIDEFNTKRYYNTGLKAIDNLVEKLSTMIASGYSIELTRRKQWKDDNTNEDYKNDNEIFHVCTKRTVNGSGTPTEMNIAEKAENFNNITGIYSPETCYNLRISPERNKLRHNGIIAPALLKYSGRVLRFTYGEGNYLASYNGTDNCDVFNNEILAGNQNVAWDNPDNTRTAIWDPIVDEFSFPLTAEQIDEMILSPKKLIQYGEDEEQIIEGWILEAEPILKTGMTKFKMLRKANG